MVQDMIENAARDALPAPHIIIIHTASNNMGFTNTAREIQESIDNLLHIVKRLFPDACLIWSDILVRRFWTEARCQDDIEETRKRLNKRIRHKFWACGGRVIRHPNIKPIYEHFQKYSVVHLSSEANRIFMDNLMDGLASFDRSPTKNNYSADVA